MAQAQAPNADGRRRIGAGPEGQLGWVTRAMEDRLIAFIVHLTHTTDTILPGRKMTPESISHWEGVRPETPEYFFALKMVDTHPKSPSAHAHRGKEPAGGNRRSRAGRSGRAGPLGHGYKEIEEANEKKKRQTNHKPHSWSLHSNSADLR
jgi:hypothetical protein